MVHYNFRFLFAGILILIHDSAVFIITGQILVGDIDVIRIRKCSLNGCRLCEEILPHVYGTKEA